MSQELFGLILTVSALQSMHCPIKLLMNKLFIHSLMGQKLNWKIDEYSTFTLVSSS